MTLQKQLLFLFICFFSYTVTGQSKPKLPAQDSLPPFTKNYPSINEDDLIDTRWQYIYATYTGSRTKVFPADENYNHYIWLKFDYTFEQYLNGQRTFGMWTLNDKRNQIYYKFKNTKWWEIVRFTKDTLILEFVDNYASLQYTFVKMPNDAAPFGPDKTMLPPLYVYNPQTGKIEKVGEKPKNNFWANLFNGPGRRAKDPNIPKEVWVDPNPKPVEIPIEIMLVGGGYFGGVDPVERNYIQIKPTGRCIKEYKTVSRDVMKTKKDIPRQQLEDLVRFIADKKFFAMSNIYDCDAPECIKRKTQKPTPIPLRLYVRYGDKQKSITVNIWGRDGNTARYINYPPELDIIIENILLISETQ